MKIACIFIVPLRWLAMAIAYLPQTVLLALGRTVTFVLWPLLASRRRIAHINLTLCFPELSSQQRKLLLQKNIVATVTGAFELMRAWYAPSRLLTPLAQIEGIEHLRQALARGQGVLLIGGHITHSELAARLLGEILEKPVRIVVRRNNNACLEQWFDAARRRIFGETIAKKDMRGLLRALQAGDVVAYSADQNFTYQSVFVPFFGVPATTLTAIPDIVHRGRAVLLPFWFYRDEQGHYQLRIEKPWSDWPSGDPTQDAARYMRELEAVVRAHPEQYLWVHRRFKTRPSGMSSVY